MASCVLSIGCHEFSDHQDAFILRLFAGEKESNMSVTVAQMSKDELKDMIAITVEEKVMELLGDPDEGLEVRKSVWERLLRQKKAVVAGERGQSIKDVADRLGLE
jgi:hypothetical protein